MIKQLFPILLILCFVKSGFSVQGLRRSNSSTANIDTDRFLLIWLDDNVRECSDDCRSTQSMLRQHIPTAEFQWDIDNVIYSIIRVKETTKMILIVVSGRKASLLLEYLTYYDLDPHISALFIFCNNIDDYQHLEHEKLVGIFADRQFLSESIRATKFSLMTKHNKVLFHLFDQEQSWSREASSTTLSHMWYQLLLEVLAVLPRDEQAKEEMLEKSKEYYVGQTIELKQIEVFNTSYTSSKAIEWYAEDSFVHKLVNKALRTENIDLLYAFRFFIGDLKVAIEREHLVQRQSHGSIASKIETGVKSLIKLYSGQKLPKRELEKFRRHLDKPIAVNSYLSTSFSESEAMDFAKRGVISDRMQRVLFEISLNTSIKELASFAEIEHRVRYTDEREVLFDCNALFDITHVEYDRYSEMWLVKMTAIAKNSIKQHSYLEVLRDTILRNHSPVVALGIILAQGFDRREQAIHYFEQILRTYPSSHQDIPDVLQQRAILYEEKGDQTSALQDYQHALDIRHERIRENLLGIASLNSHIGILQSTQMNFSASLASHQEALTLYDELYGTNTDHWTKAKVNENIGLVYYKNGSIVEASEYFMRAWDMYNRVLPSKHPSTIELLGYIGGTHEAANESILAVEYFHRQLNWTEKALPMDHPLFIRCLDSVSRVHTKFDQTSSIPDLFRDYFENVKEMLGEHHPVIPRLLVTVASLFESTQPSKAIELYEQALTSNEDWTNLNQDIVYTSHKNLAQLYRKTKHLNSALKHAMEALTYQQKHAWKTQDDSLEANELYTIGSIFLELNQSTNALQYLTKALTIYQSHDHPNVQLVLISIIQAANQRRDSKSE